MIFLRSLKLKGIMEEKIIGYIKKDRNRIISFWAWLKLAE